MRGPEHYKEAERLVEAWADTIEQLEGAKEAEWQNSTGSRDLAAQTLAAAQIHATLALAAYWADDKS